MQGIKYVLFLFLCVGGCVLSKFGIGPGLVSMSPQRSSSFFRMWLFIIFFVLVMLFLLVRYFCLLVRLMGLEAL